MSTNTKSSLNKKLSSSSKRNKLKPLDEKKSEENFLTENQILDEEDPNSGFSNYMRSSHGKNHFLKVSPE